MSGHDYTPQSKVGKWFNDRLPLLSLANHLTDYPTPKNLNYWWTFGGILTFCLLIQIVTGITLAMHYIAHADMAFESVEHIMRDVNYGWLTNHNLHLALCVLHFQMPCLREQYNAWPKLYLSQFE